MRPRTGCGELSQRREKRVGIKALTPCRVRDQINSAFRKRIIREIAEEIRKWFREWRPRNTVTGDLGPTGDGTTPTDAPQGRSKLIYAPPTAADKEGTGRNQRGRGS